MITKNPAPCESQGSRDSTKSGSLLPSRLSQILQTPAVWFMLLLPIAGCSSQNAGQPPPPPPPPPAVQSPGITVDFGSRTNTQHAIRPGMIGANHVDWLPDRSNMSLISAAGITLSRTYANIPAVYRTKTPDWTQIDPQISDLQAEGFHVLLQVAYTPKWLHPKGSPCAAGHTAVAPASTSEWAQLAKSFVAHMDTKFPGVVTDYEIWNEPDAGGLCQSANRLSTYLALYAAAAPLMKQQAAADGATIRVGGPALSVVDPSWFQALLSNSSTAPYVDFVSYHHYVGNAADIGAAWDTNNGHVPLFQLTQDSSTGAAATYTQVAQLVAAGKQPLGASAPIYLDEFNTNWIFAKDCCRNDPTYAPVWNALFVSDLLNTVYSGAAQVPAQMTYFSANTHPYFCLIGIWNANMDCEIFGAGTPALYPQYYAYQLMAAPEYLGLGTGGYMAASIATTASGAGLVTTAFYTGKQDSILIVNPTGTSYSETVSAQNTGFSSPVANLYQVVNGQSISRSTLALMPSGTGYSMSVAIPAYTVVGISIQGQ